VKLSRTASGTLLPVRNPGETRGETHGQTGRPRFFRTSDHPLRCKDANLWPLTSNLTPSPAAPPPPPHPAQHSPRSCRAIPHPALPFNQLPHPPHRPLPRSHHLRTPPKPSLH